MTDKPDAGATERALVFECDLEAPPEKVWRALAEPELLAAWLMPSDMRAPAQAGERFQLRPAANDDAPGGIDCEVLESDPPHRLRYGWREGPRDGRGLDSTVTFILRGTAGGGTRLVIVHDGFAAMPAIRPAPVMSAAPPRMAA